MYMISACVRARACVVQMVSVCECISASWRVDDDDDDAVERSLLAETNARISHTCLALRKVTSLVVSAASLADFVNESQKLMSRERERESRVMRDVTSYLLNNTI